MALLFAKTKFNIAFSSRLRASILKIFRGPTMEGPGIDIGYWIMSSTFKVLDSHVYPPVLTACK